MDYWTWWVSGLALSGVMLAHWILLNRMMAVSGRVSALVDRVRHGAPEPQVEMTPEEMMAAIQAATAEEFDLEASSESPSQEEPEAVTTQDAAKLTPMPPRTATQHVLFMSGLVGGGFLATLLGGGHTLTLSLAGDGFAQLSQGNPIASTAILFVGGALVGFGTRMSGGCTSGHGLCGTSRLQPGSLVATAAFFGAGIAASLGLGALL